MPTTTISGYLPPELAADVAEYQAETGKTDSEMVREGIETLLKQEGHL